MICRTARRDGHAREVRFDGDAQGSIDRSKPPVPFALDLTEHGGHVELGSVGWVLTGEGKQVVDRALEPINLAERGFECHAVIGSRVEARGFEVDAETRERRSQLVRCVLAEGPFARQHLVESGCGAVQRVGDGVDLRHSARLTPRGEVTVAQLGGSASELLDRAREAT